MSILDDLENVYCGSDVPFLVGARGELSYTDVSNAEAADLSGIDRGDVVALIGDFEPTSIKTLLRLTDLGVVIVPLTTDTRPLHDYFFEAAHVTVVIESGTAIRLPQRSPAHPLLDQLRKTRNSGLVLFSTGTTGDPKAILHDFQSFLVRYRTARPAFRVMNFLLFDHIGGINTLLHTLYNRGVVVVPSGREPHTIMKDVERFDVQVLPTTPTFLRIMLAGGVLDDGVPDSLRIITYGTERMDQVTLNSIAELLPNVDLRQTYGMSELGILRVRSKARNSLFMKVGGEGVETRVVNGVLQIRAEHRMLGYLNAEPPFDAEGWYDTGDIVEKDGDYLRVVGRTNEVINIGGIKVNPSQIESHALEYPGVSDASAYGVENPITGQHIELVCEPKPGSEISAKEIRQFLRGRLSRDVVPHRVRIGTIAHNHRFKSR